MAMVLFGGRFEASRRTLALAIGDVAMIALFVLLGELRHRGTLLAGVETFVQFAVGWLLVSVIAGVYSGQTLEDPRRAVVQVVAAWVLAAVIGQLVRLAMTPGNFIHPSFVAVTIGFGGALLAGWRYVAARFVWPHPRS